MTQPAKILAFAGSLRKGSFNKMLVKIALEGAKEIGATVTYIDLNDYQLPLYDQDMEEKEGLPENALKLKKLFAEHDGFLIACPEYNSSMPAVFKNAIDWVSRKATPQEKYLSCFIDKIVVLMSASLSPRGGSRGLRHVREMFSNVFSLVLPIEKTIAEAHNAFDEKGRFKDIKEEEGVKKLGKTLAEFIQKLNR